MDQPVSDDLRNDSDPASTDVPAQQARIALLAEAELQTAAPVPEGARLVVYVGLDGRLWARPAEEFHDGRFSFIKTPG